MRARAACRCPLYLVEREIACPSASLSAYSRLRKSWSTGWALPRRWIRRIKLKIAPGEDVEFVAAVRKAFPRAALQVDANSAYSLGDADVFKAMDDLDLLLIEQPLGPMTSSITGSSSSD